MACEYFVNGDWVTENQLKELLNAGLLDTLISDGTIDIKGFKLDSAKVIKTETFTKKHEAIPASKLAKILANEVKTRQGYPQNMLSSLELNADGTDFKIPLWASPYKDKFESLLTSLVSNKVVKQKFPGNSYVLGSQEGFQVKEGDDAAGELKKSNIVFTSSFDPSKGLQPMRWDFENKKILPAQIMIPFKFRDENGAILPLKDFIIKGEDGRMLLDTTKLPEKLLQLFGFRIPTQERNSMAAVEIVGFLPEASGDLMLAPRDFTKQMGSDFDVDKLYTYMYNHFYKDGKIQTGFMSDKKKIAASLKIQMQHLDWIKNELKLNREDKKLIDAYIEEKIEYAENGTEISSELAVKASELIANAIAKSSGIVVISEGSAQKLTYDELSKTLDNTIETISILKRSYKASRQNNIIDIHLRIMKSSNPEIINSIMALDSFGEFEGLATEINNSRNADKALPIILSDSYQRTKFINATAGKNGVGSFSLDSTFNATAQGKEITLENLTEETREALFGTFLDPRIPTTAELLENNLPLATFGEVESKGDISGKYTLKSQNLINKAKAEKRELTTKEKESLKFKSTIIRALQSTAVDNEKAQILDKLNINDETFDVIRALTLLGFEEKEIVGLITQEIIWEYVDKLRDARSSLTSYNPNAEKDIFTALAAKYDPKGAYQELNPSILEQMSSKSGEDLINNIKNKSLTIDPKDNTPDFNLEQLAILEKFQNLTEIGKNIKVLQSTINTESSGIPKSLLETESKVEQIQRLPYLKIFNAQKLLGEYSEGKLADPTTINGYASYYGTMFADQIFNEYFPYKNIGFKTIISEVRTHLPKGASMSMSKLVETQGEVFNEMRSYLYANTNTNLFGENPDVERRRLFIDSKKTATKPKNDSLATILNGLSTNPWFQKNGFLNKLSFDINKNGTISRINFEAAAGENFDERNIYDGFNYLLSKNFSVGRFNGIDYTSRMLAQELVAAAFLEGGKQGSKQYLKFVPTAYLKSLGFGEYLQGVPFDFVNTFYGNVAEDGPIYSQPSAFTRQYLQNNPDKTKTVSLSNLKGNIVASPEGSFTLNEEALKDNFVEVTDPNTGEPTLTQTHFLSIYDTKLPSKYALYEFDSVDRVYRRIPVLSGSYGFVGYNSQARNAMPAEIKNVVTSPAPQQGAPGYTISGIPTAPSKEFKIDVVNNTAKKDSIADLGISRNLAGTAEALDDLLNNIETAEGVSTLNRQLLQIIRGLQLPENFNVTYNKTNSRGSYSASTGTLNINLNHPRNQDANGLAVVVAHELIHTFTAASIKAYQSGNIDGLSAKTIDAIQKLEYLQKLYINQLIAKEGNEGLKEFQRLYTNFKEGRSTVFSPDAKNLPEYLSKYYGAIKLEEFVTMALTDVGFQEHLNSITDEAGISIWEQLKELLADLLNALGLDIKPGSALASTVKSTMDLIQANQETLKENNIDIKEFFESGNSYKFQVDGNGKVIKAEYAQGNGILKAMNAKNGQKKYDELKNKPNTQGASIAPFAIKPIKTIKEGVAELFKANPELAKIGTQEEYSQYLDGVFPNSKVKNILYHGTAAPNVIEQLTPQNDRIYFSDLTTASRYASWDQFNREQYEPGAATKLQSIAAIVNLENPTVLDGVNYTETETNKEGDGIIGTNITDPLGGIEDQILVRSAEQTLALGSTKDIKGFKAFVATKPIQISKYEVVGNEILRVEDGSLAGEYESHEEALENLKGWEEIEKYGNLSTKTYELFPGVFANAGQTIAINKLKEFLESDEKAFLLEGKGGTGKTTIIKQILAQVGDKRILAIAPSHKAKKVLAKSLKGINADIRTLASALAIKLDESTGKFEPDTFARDKGRVPIKNGQIIVIDESSMVSDELLSEIKKWVSQGAKVIFMGDRAQLPPVGQEKDSDVFGLKNNYTLTEKMRQAATSPIIGIGTKIAANAENNTSRVANPITSTDRVDMYDAVSGSSITWEKSEDTALTQFVEDVQQAKGDVNFAKIVTFNNQNHSSGQSVKNLNRKVRTKLFGDRAATEKFIPGEILTAYDSYNPNQGKEEVDIVFFNSEDMVVVSSEFSPEYLVNVNVYSGAKGTRNKNYKFDVDLLTLRDDAGKIVSQNGNPVKIPIIAESSKEEYAATLKQLWNTDRQLAYALQAKFGNLEYGYALTSHKAQGSTYTNVYVMEDNIMGSSNAGSNKAKNQSLYVAVSRPTTKLVMVSNKNTGKIEAPTGLNLSVLGNLSADYSSMPTSSYGEDEGSKNENRPSDDDWDAYQKMMGENELLGDFTFDSEEFKNYLLICGK